MVLGTWGVTVPAPNTWLIDLAPLIPGLSEKHSRFCGPRSIVEGCTGPLAGRPAPQMWDGCPGSQRVVKPPRSRVLLWLCPGAQRAAPRLSEPSARHAHASRNFTDQHRDWWGGVWHLPC